MSERGIIFSAPMVKALLNGSKSQTRRVLKPQPETVVQTSFGYVIHDHKSVRRARLPSKGDRLWVREAWGHDAPDLDTCRRGVESDGMNYGPYYFADGRLFDNHTIKRCSPIHMPRWASRLTLTVTDVRVQRLHDITDEDALAEGVGPRCQPDPNHPNLIWVGTPNVCKAPALAYRDLWNSIHGTAAWDANPWICALTFTAENRNIDSTPVPKREDAA